MVTLRLALTPAEVADLLGLSLSSVYRAMGRNELAYEVVSGRKLIPAASLEDRFGKAVDIDLGDAA